MQKITGISSAQIRAARALLDWSQEDLANACTLSIGTIRKLELGHISPRSSTTQTIRYVIEQAGLEFLEPDGLRRRPDDVAVYQGKDGVPTFIENIIFTTKIKPAIVYVVISQLGYSRFALDICCELERIVALGAAINIQCLTNEGVDGLPLSLHCEYRNISSSYVEPVPFISYGNKYALLDSGNDIMPKIIVFQSYSMADASRRHFLSMWNKATQLDYSQITTKNLERLSKYS